MAIDKLNNHYSMTNPASVYDEEALTALELAGRTAAKVNEVVESQNNVLEAQKEHERFTENTLEHFEHDTIPIEVRDEVQRRIDDGDFDESIDKYAGQLRARVDNLVHNIPEGSTTMDAEIIDARMRYNHDVSDISLSHALHNIYREGFTPKFPQLVGGKYNANYCIETGSYWVGSGFEWENIPLGSNSLHLAGHLVTINDLRVRQEIVTSEADIFYINGVMTQLFIPIALDGIYIRCKKGIDSQEFYEWQKIPTTSVLNDVQIRKKISSDVSNIDDIRDNGYYFIGSSTQYKNLPEGENAGLLMSYKGHNDYTIYHIFFSFTGNVYTRNTKVDTTFKMWTRLATTNDISTGGSGGSTVPANRYTVKKTSDTSIDIYEHQTKGDVVYHYGYVDGLARIFGVDFKLSDGTSKMVVGSGHDIEGVLKEDGVFKGGVHGNETSDEAHDKINVNGKPYTWDTLPETVECDHITLCEKGSIVLAYDEQVVRTKKLVFDEDGLHVENMVTGTGANGFDFYYGMVSVMKDVCDTYSDNTETFFNPVTITDPDSAPMFDYYDMYGTHKATFTGAYGAINTSSEIISPTNAHGMGADNIDKCLLYNYGDRLKLYRYITNSFDNKITRCNIQFIVGG